MVLYKDIRKPRYYRQFRPIFCEQRVFREEQSRARSYAMAGQPVPIR